MQGMWKYFSSLGVLAACACTAYGGDKADLKIHVLGETWEAARTPDEATLILVPIELESELSRQAARSEGAARDRVEIAVAQATRAELPDLCSNPESPVLITRLKAGTAIRCDPPEVSGGPSPAGCTQPPPPPPLFSMYLAECVTPDMGSWSR